MYGKNLYTANIYKVFSNPAVCSIIPKQVTGEGNFVIVNPAVRVAATHTAGFHNHLFSFACLLFRHHLTYGGIFKILFSFACTSFRQCLTHSGIFKILFSFACNSSRHRLTHGRIFKTLFPSPATPGGFPPRLRGYREALLACLQRTAKSHLRAFTLVFPSDTKHIPVASKSV